MGKKELENILKEKGFLKSEKVIEAFENVDRKDFVPDDLETKAYANYPLPIGEGQTISQPLTVVVMTEALDVHEGMKILEVGSGSGYQAALLAEMVGKQGKVITTEINERLYGFSKNNLENYRNVEVIHKDGSKGFKERSPYDRIIVTADCPKIPKPLIEQLKERGIMVLPKTGKLFLIEKNDSIEKTYLGPFSFVPLRGRHGHN